MKKLSNILESDPELNNPETGTDKNTIHSYVKDFYENEFLKFQNKNINLLEIGIYHGGSMLLWSEYFNNASIYGIDITNSNILERYKDTKNTKQIFTNAYDCDFANSLPDFDIIIDDGPHTIESQIDCINIYLPKLKEGGVLIIEDIQYYDYFATLDKITPDKYKNNIQHLDLRASGRFDNLMFIIRK
jgi:cephalosporin hydroxylase